MKQVAITLLLAGAWIACAGSESAGRDGFVDCSAGQSRSCDCGQDTTGIETCTEAGVFGSCNCSDAKPALPESQPNTNPRLCSSQNDGGAKPAKKCQVCDFDVAPSTDTVCPAAPACGNGILGAPANPKLRGDLSVYTDNGKPVPVEGDSPPAGTTACLDPQIRLRVERLKVHRGSGEGYCIVEANDGITSEAAVTMKTSKLKDGDDFPFPVGQATLWGQGQPECTSNNLTLTYYCFKVVDNSAWSAALKAMGDTAAQVGGSPAGASPYGWAFGLGGAAANAVAAGIAAAQKDEIRIKVQQTIPVAQLLDLTNGRTWSVRTRVKDGCDVFGCDRDFDWELTVQAWGCADKLPAPR